MRAVSMSPDDAPSVIAMKRVGEVFHEYKSDSSVMIVLEGDKPLGDDAHAFYDADRSRSSRPTPSTSQHVQDFWSDPLTAVGRAEQRRQGRLRPGVSRRQPGRGAGQRIGRGRAEHRRRRCRRRRVSRPTSPAPRRWRPISTSPATAACKMIEAVTFVVIITMLLLVYRSIVTVLLTLVDGRVRAGRRPRAWSRSSATTRSSASRRSPPTCWSRWRSPPRPTTRSS